MVWEDDTKATTERPEVTLPSLSGSLPAPLDDSSFSISTSSKVGGSESQLSVEPSKPVFQHAVETVQRLVASPLAESEEEGEPEVSPRV